MRAGSLSKTLVSSAVILLAFTVSLGLAGYQFGPSFAGQVEKEVAKPGFKVVKTLDSGVSPWARIECLKADGDFFVEEPFHPKGCHTHSVIEDAFGTSTPHSNLVLLHFGPNWNKGAGKVPVLMVHGAGSHAFHSWCHPYHLEVPQGQAIDKPGLMQYLSSKGVPVFAVTFSHMHGDNFLQAAQLANAIERIRQVTKTPRGAKFAVDVVCHSKGVMPVRIYASSMGEAYPEYSFVPAFRGDIGKIVFVGAPLKGIDTPFRYYPYNLTVVSKEIAAPLGPDTMLMYGFYSDFKEYNLMFPGQFQMLNNWVRDGIGFSYQSMTPDALLTMSALYNGGISALLTSRGIDRAAADAGNVIEKLNSRGLDPSITSYVLAGSKQAIDHILIGFYRLPVGEMAAPSDGVVFLKSSTWSEGLTPRGAKVAKVKEIDTHHVGLIVLPAAMEFVGSSLLGRDTD